MKLVKLQQLCLLSLLFIFSCASNTQTTGSGVVLPETLRGTGRDMSAVTAIHKAKIDVVRKSTLALLGEKQFQLYEPQLKINVLSPSNPDDFIYRESLKNINLQKDGEFFTYELEMRVNWTNLKRAITSSGVVMDSQSGGDNFTSDTRTGSDSTGNTSSLNPNAQRARDLITGETRSTGTQTGSEGTDTANTPPGNTSLEATADDWGAATDEEKSIIRRYVDTMTYMVYFADAPTEDPAILKAAVTKANEYLAQKTIETIDMSQIEKIKADQKVLYEESTGNNVSFVQWIAQKLNADVYVEIEATSSGRTVSSSRHFGSVNLNIKLYDPSTAQLLGSVPYKTDEGFSDKNQLDAKILAIRPAFLSIMPRAIEQAKGYMLKTLTRGIKYEVILQNTSDSRLMSRFRTSLARRVKAVNVVSSSASETKYEVYYIGMIADLEDLIYQVTDTLPGLEGMNKVIQRGKSLTMNTGL
ncbi:MAG: hypothetical protein A2Z96_04400 [Spirochaetes bacterium GWB1_48_6]|nr:MAG: hypothetical protein A2Z96_04400 [Spirochaetes bacterium GWB1_48_6]